MLSPFKLCPMEMNSLLINENLKLANDLSNFFAREENKYLWTLNTHRQTTTYALRNTQSIMLRKLVVKESLSTTKEFNQVMDVDDSSLMDMYPIFKEMVTWLEESFKSKGVTTVEWGRIFFSKFFAHTDIDTHIDEGKYFSYYDRFHFVIDSPKDCIFHIREEDLVLDNGGMYWVNNHVPHYLKNNGDTDRINLIFDARLI